jgi:hypothetical protein
MPVNFIDGFMSNLRGKGLAKANRYLVLIQPNQFVASSLGYNSEEIKQRLALTCSSVALPSKSFMTHDISITQPARLVPYAINSNNSAGASIEFHVLGDMFEKNIFEMWQNIIIDPVSKQQSYYDDYTKGSSIVIAELPNMVPSLDAALASIVFENRISGVRLTEIYPYNFTINGGNQSYAAVSEPLKVKVDFMFREITKLGEPKIPGITEDMKIVDENGNFTREMVKETAKSISARVGLLRNIDKKFNIPGISDALITDSAQDYQYFQRTETESNLEKIEYRNKNFRKNSTLRGIEGNVFDPQRDGLPAQNPNDEISQLFTQGLAFVSQGQGFLGW